jgi:IS30 family transposase
MNQSKPTDKNDDLGNSTKQTRKERAILALLQYPTTEKAAAALNLHPSTLYRWLKQPDFRDKFIAARAAAFTQSLARLQQAAPAATTRLLRLIANDATPAGSAIRACDAILKHAARGFELDTIEARLTKLEKGYRPGEDPSAS